jgi:16S rRNA (guanine(966)-N(2))-methyltransferase RsmD
VRIIAGQFGGRRIVAPRGLATRPTSDRVREALFSILGNIEGFAVLDLYAGSGALGLEALSRGARFATFVERARAPVVALRENIAALDVEADSAVFVTDVRAAIRALGKSGARVGLVFADPPYADKDTAALLESLVESGLLDEGAIVVLEHSSKVTPPDPDPDRVLRSTRVYGDTALTFYHYPAPEVT